MRAWLVPVLLLLLPFAAQQALAREESGMTVGHGQEFAVIALHDVADDPQQLDDTGVSSGRLVAFFDWLAGNGWTAISLDDIARARRGEKALPEKAVLITIDDGYASLYTRVFPLALAYRMPVVAAVVGAWLDVPEGGTVQYGGRPMPRSQFISWAQAREMQDSGLVEFASHSYGLHDVVQGNPQGNLLPAAVTRRFTPGQGYEDEAAFRARLRADLQRSREQLQRELGRAPRALAWPYGRYNEAGLLAARETGFEFGFSLDPEPGHASSSMSLGRYLPADDPGLGEWAGDLRFHGLWPNAIRIVGIDPAALADADPAVADARLGKAIERLSALGATHVLLDAATADAGGRLTSTWFPNSQLPVRQDLLPRLAAQMHTRAGVQAMVRLPHAAALRALGEPQRVRQLFRELGAQVPADALLLEDVPSLATDVAAGRSPWQVRARREAVDTSAWPAADALALQAFHEAERERPGLKLFWLAPDTANLTRPAALADATLVPVRLDDRLPEAGGGDGDSWLDAATAQRSGLWWSAHAPPDAAALAAATRAFQQHGGVIVGWRPDVMDQDAPVARHAAPIVSARRFPAPGAIRP